MRLLALAATNSWQGRIAGSRIACVGRPGPKTIKKSTNSTPNKSQTQRLVLT